MPTPSEGLASIRDPTLPYPERWGHPVRRHHRSGRQPGSEPPRPRCPGRGGGLGRDSGERAQAGPPREEAVPDRPPRRRGEVATNGSARACSSRSANSRLMPSSCSSETDCARREAPPRQTRPSHAANPHRQPRRPDSSNASFHILAPSAGDVSLATFEQQHALNGCSRRSSRRPTSMACPRSRGLRGQAPHPVATKPQSSRFVRSCTRAGEQASLRSSRRPRCLPSGRL